MPTPIVEQVEQELITLLSSITVIAGDSNTLVVLRSDEEGVSPNNCTCVVERADINITDDAPLNHDGYLQTFNLYVFAAESQSSSVSPDARTASLEADIIKKLSTNYTLNGKAHNLFVQPITRGSVGQLPARLIPVQVEFFTDVNDPYSQNGA
jgi:hypothetical protein